MKYYRVLAAASIFTFFACNTNRLYETPDASAFKGGTLPAPPGMVYVPSGTILYKSSLDSNDVGRNVSLSAFFIDKTEVTNKQYRAFVDWVADSIAVTDFLNDDQYFLADAGDGTSRQINWDRVKKVSPLWKSRDLSIQSRLAPMITMQGTKRVLNPEVVKYRFSYLKAGNGQGEPVHVVDTVSVMPVEDIWSKDFPNAQLMFMDANYFNHETYDNHPVVALLDHVSPTVEQLTAILIGVHPEFRILPSHENRRAIEALSHIRLMLLAYVVLFALLVVAIASQVVLFSRLGTRD